MKPRRVAPVALAVATLALSSLAVGGCASGTGGGSRIGSRGGADRDVEISRLKDRVLELQRRLSVTEVEVDRLRREVARLKGAPIEENARPETPARSPGRSADRPVDRSGGSVDRRSGTDTGAAGADTGRAASADAQRGFEIEDIDEPSPAPPSEPPRAVEETPARVRVEPPAPEPAQSSGRRQRQRRRRRSS